MAEETTVVMSSASILPMPAAVTMYDVRTVLDRDSKDVKHVLEMEMKQKK